ncbi:MAG: ABC transporter permease [Myxococcales bacterium]|nr:ABC transporter permease [Myxococcota bacterium]MDW8282080.1 ABC transporter permease [Myxococcales bacterium]
MIPVAYNLRSLAVRRTTTLATAFGVALVVFVLASARMLSEGIRRTLGQGGRADTAIVLRKGSDAELASSIEEPMVGLVLAAPGVARDSRGGGLGVGEVVVVITMEKAGMPGQVSNVLVRGVPDHVMQLRPEVRIVAGRPARPGTDEVIIGQRIAGRFVGLELGRSFELRKNRPVVVVGVFAAEGSSFESEIWGDLNTVRNSFGREGIVSSVRVRLESPAKFDAFAAAVAQDKQLGLEAMRETDFLRKASEGTAEFVGILGMLIALFFSIGAMIGAMITMYASIASRQREIGTLRALGFSRLSILASFLLEAVLLALLGGLVGAGMSLLMGFVRFSMINFATWSEVVFSFSPTVEIIGSALAFAAGMGVLGGLLPAVRAARLSPLQAIRG